LLDKQIRRCSIENWVEELPDSQLFCKARSPHETVSEGKALKSVFDYNRNRKHVSPNFGVMSETVG